MTAAGRKWVYNVYGWKMISDGSAVHGRRQRESANKP